jgi:hypothetical protein
LKLRGLRALYCFDVIFNNPVALSTTPPVADLYALKAAVGSRNTGQNS